MKTLYYTATSLDGFLATEDDSLEWLFLLGNVSDSSYPEFIAQVGALAMGASTYEWILRHSNKMVEETGSAWLYSQPCWVFSHRALPLPTPDADIRFVQGDVQPVHTEMCLAATNKNIWIVGGGDLAGQFFDVGLLDGAVIQVASVTLGKGKPLFPRRVISPSWQLLSVRQVGTSFAELRYQIPKCSIADARRGDETMSGVHNLSIFINRKPSDVYKFASDPRNLPLWAAGLAASEVVKDGEEWIASSPFGKVRIKFADENRFGVLDHDVRLESGVVVHNPMRVVLNRDGSEFLFTLFRQPGSSDEEFARDRSAVENDLRTLKRVLEQHSSAPPKTGSLD